MFIMTLLNNININCDLHMLTWRYLSGQGSFLMIDIDNLKIMTFT